MQSTFIAVFGLCYGCAVTISIFCPSNPPSEKPMRIYSLLIPFAFASRLQQERWMDQTSDPCSDFYEHACGGFARQHKPGDNVLGLVIWLFLRQIGQRNGQEMEQILQSSPKHHLLSKYYFSCLDTESIRHRDIQPLIPLAAEIITRSKVPFSEITGWLYAHAIYTFFRGFSHILQ